MEIERYVFVPIADTLSRKLVPTSNMQASMLSREATRWEFNCLSHSLMQNIASIYVHTHTHTHTHTRTRTRTRTRTVKVNPVLLSFRYDLIVGVSWLTLASIITSINAANMFMYVCALHFYLHCVFLQINTCMCVSVLVFLILLLSKVYV